MPASATPKGALAKSERPHRESLELTVGPSGTAEVERRVADGGKPACGAPDSHDEGRSAAFASPPRVSQRTD